MRRKVPQYDYVPNGDLVLKIESKEYLKGLRRQWNESTKNDIDDCIKGFIAGMAKVAVRIRSRRLQHKERERQWAEERRKRAEAEQRRQEEQRKVNELTKWVDGWHRSRKTRRFLAALRKSVIDQHGRIEEGSEMDKWLKWAYGYADRIDPLVPRST